MFYYYIYYALTYILNWVFPILLNKRLKLGKEHPIRYKEKLGKYTITRNKGKIIWFHVASVGEFNSIISLVREIEQTTTVLVTTVTLGALKVFKKAKFKNSIHQFAPVDTPQVVNKFLKYWHPDLGIFIDSELWPNLLVASAKRFNLINLNARLSDKSASNWGYIKPMANYIYDNFTLVLPCSKYDMQKISRFISRDKLKFIGNLKFCAEDLKINYKELIKFKKILKNQTIIVAASTHKGEEKIILNAFKQLRNDHEKVFLFIVPRHSSRGNEITQICQEFNLSYSLRSNNDTIAADHSVYIADTIGEIGIWYSLSSIVIMGGTFVSVGGHNIIEPAKLDNAIIVGPYTSNIKDIVDTFSERKAIIKSNATKLTNDLEKLISKPHYCNELADKALTISDNEETLDMAKNIIFSIQ